MPSGVSFVAIAAAALFAFAFHAANDFAPIDTYFPPQPINSSVESHFSHTYYDARALFRARTHNVTDAKLYTLPLPGYENVDLSIDVAVVPGSSERALVHISGTHGVEGFAGSGIQSALLERLSGQKKRSKDAPTLVFVHALNPYGFAKLRRFNENNVDLNRNFLTPEEFKTRIAMDPNVFGYVNMLEVLNPPNPVTWSSLATTLYGVVHGEVTYGQGATKRAAVCGNYHFPKTIFYGGDKQQASGALLQKFLQDHLDYEQLQQVGVIDVHTGLGPPGVDTLMLNASADRDQIERIFPHGNVVITGDEDDDASKGYDGVAGLLCNGFG
ncbi:Rxlr-like protein, partial [Globisporangium splendens]